MKDYLKGIGTWILAVLIIIILGIAILLLRCFVFDKIDFGFGKNSKKNNQKNNLSNTRNENGVSEFIGDAYDAYQNTDVSDKNYNAYNFDDSILLYEGDQIKGGTVVVLDKLIENADNSFYSKPSVQTENFGNSGEIITYTNSEDYKTALREVKNYLEDNGNYSISFGYSALHTVVNKIIITKK